MFGGEHDRGAFGCGELEADSVRPSRDDVKGLLHGSMEEWQTATDNDEGAVISKSNGSDRRVLVEEGEKGVHDEIPSDRR